MSSNADIVREELAAAQVDLDREHDELLEQLRVIQRKLTQTDANREAMRLTRVYLGRKWVEDENDDGMTLAEAMTAPVEEPPPAPEPIPQDPEPEPPAAPDEVPEPVSGEYPWPGASDRIKAVEALAREMGIFTIKRLAAGLGLASSTINDPMKELSERGFFLRRGGERGPNVYFVHRDHTGEDSLALAKGEEPKPTASDDDIERVRDFVVSMGEGNPFVLFTVSDKLSIPAEKARAALDALTVRSIVRQKNGGRFEYIPPTRRAAA